MEINKNQTTRSQLVANAVDELGGLDLLVNNAGKQQSVDSILDLTPGASYFYLLLGEI